MQKIMLPFHVGAVMLVLWAGQRTLGQSLPPDQLVTYAIHEDANDPNSMVEFEVSLTLKASMRRGHQIRWFLDTLRIHQKLGDGAGSTWVDENPSAQTSSGEWWVQHAAPNNPANEDFAILPKIDGVGHPQGVSTELLSYNLEGLVYVPPTSRAPWSDTTASLTYTFVVDGAIIAEGKDEPVELPPVGGPDGGN